VARVRAGRRARRGGELRLVRVLPGDGALRRCWAGTKLISLVLVSVALFLWPTWSGEGVVALVLAGALVATRVPRGALGRAPGWLLALLAVGALLALVAGGRPQVRVFGASVELGGIESFARLVVLAAEVLVAAALVGWTTPVADLAPALGRLLAPLRRLRVPVDELVGTTALAVRCLPLLAEELRVLRAAREARAPERPVGGLEARLEDLAELVTAAVAAALRRASELAAAIDARGGVPTAPPESHRLALLDAVVLGLVVAAVAVVAVVR
jgi:energy-coupling factor transporter transmembrane protein EcfT